MGYRYATALHWSLTQFTPASMEVVARSTPERVYTVVVLLTAMITFSSFVSSITNAMTRLRHLNVERQEQHAALRKYLRERRAPADLVARIWGCIFQEKHKGKRLVHQRDVALLAMIPKNLHAELNHEVFTPIFAKHPFFHFYATATASVMRKIYLEAVVEVFLSIGQELFADGDIAESMFFLIRGELIYKSRWLDKCPILEEGAWLCEPVLWLRWTHRGAMTAKTHSELVALRSERFRQIAGQSLYDLPQPTVYANLFYNQFYGCGAAAAGGDVPVLTDAWAERGVLEGLAGDAFARDDEDSIMTTSTTMTATTSPRVGSRCVSGSLGTVCGG